MIGPLAATPLGCIHLREHTNRRRLHPRLPLVLLLKIHPLAATAEIAGARLLSSPRRIRARPDVQALDFRVQPGFLVLVRGLESRLVG